MKDLAEKFKQIAEDSKDLTDIEWENKYGFIPYWEVMINLIAERDKEIKYASIAIGWENEEHFRYVIALKNNFIIYKEKISDEKIPHSGVLTQIDIENYLKTRLEKKSNNTFLYKKSGIITLKHKKEKGRIYCPNCGDDITILGICRCWDE